MIPNNSILKFKNEHEKHSGEVLGIPWEDKMILATWDDCQDWVKAGKPIEWLEPNHRPDP
jgi:hypothetical protein